MKKFIIFAFPALLAAAIILTFTLSRLPGAADIIPDKQENTPASADAVQVLSTGSKDAYTIKEYNEKIGIFKHGESVPEKVLNVYVFSLPERDRTLLGLGFDIDGSALDSVIEDYTG